MIILGPIEVSRPLGRADPLLSVAEGSRGMISFHALSMPTSQLLLCRAHLRRLYTEIRYQRSDAFHSAPLSRDLRARQNTIGTPDAQKAVKAELTRVRNNAAWDLSSKEHIQKRRQCPTSRRPKQLRSTYVVALTHMSGGQFRSV